MTPSGPHGEASCAVCGDPPAQRRRQGAWDLAPTIKELQASGVTSLRAIAAKLNEQNIPARGSGEWSAVQVSRA